MKRKIVVFFGVIGLFALMPFMVNAEDLTSDLTLSGNSNACYIVKSGSNVTLNLAGYTLTNNGNCDTVKIEKGATLTITGNGTIDNVNHGMAAVYNNGTTTIENGTITRSKADSSTNTYYAVLNHGVMTIKNASINMNDTKSSLVDNGYYDFTKTSNDKVGFIDGVGQAKPTLTVENGTFTGGVAAIKNDDAGVTIINNGTFTGVVALQNANEMTINGGTFSTNKDTKQSKVIVNNAFPGDKDVGKLEINGGTFNAIDSQSIFSILSEKYSSYEITINNGTFNGPIFDDISLPDPQSKKVLIAGGTFKASTDAGNKLNEDVVENNKVQGAQKLVTDDGTVYLGYKVTVHYVDSNGKAIANDTVNYHNANETYKTTPISISGYTKTSVKGNELGKSTYNNVEVTYVYSKNTMFRESTIENPNTLDNIGLFFVIATISLLGVGVTFNKLRKD